eukprot:3251899-Rhodomonas_salina.2
MRVHAFGETRGCGKVEGECRAARSSTRVGAPLPFGFASFQRSRTHPRTTRSGSTYSSRKAYTKILAAVLLQMKILSRLVLAYRLLEVVSGFKWGRVGGVLGYAP